MCFTNILYCQSIAIAGYTEIKSKKVVDFNTIDFIENDGKYYVFGLEKKYGDFDNMFGKTYVYTNDYELLTFNQSFKLISIKKLNLFGKRKNVNFTLIKNQFAGRILYIFSQLNYIENKVSKYKLYCNVIDLASNKREFLEIASSTVNIQYRVTYLESSNEFMIENKSPNSVGFNDDISIISEDLKVSFRIPKLENSALQTIQSINLKNGNYYRLCNSQNQENANKNILIEYKRNGSIDSIVFDTALNFKVNRFYKNAKEDKLFMCSEFIINEHQRFNLYGFDLGKGIQDFKLLFHFGLNDILPSEFEDISKRPKDIDLVELIKLIEVDSAAASLTSRMDFTDKMKYYLSYAELHNYNILTSTKGTYFDYSTTKESNYILDNYFNAADTTLYVIHQSRQQITTKKTLSYQSNSTFETGPTTIYALKGNSSNAVLTDTSKFKYNNPQFIDKSMVLVGNHLLLLGVTDNYYIDLKTQKNGLINMKDEALKGKVSMVIFINRQENFLVPLMKENGFLKSYLLLKYNN